MKFIAFLLATLSVVAAFAPAPTTVRSSTELNALFDAIKGMDLFAPNKEVNNYGARSKKNLKVASITDKSYVPTGLSKAQYDSIRKKEAAKKASNYDRNVKKAGKFQGFDQFYEKRGTAEGGAWLKAPGRGHTFAKTKYDMGADLSSNTKGWKDATGSIFGIGKK